MSCVKDFCVIAGRRVRALFISSQPLYSNPFQVFLLKHFLAESLSVNFALHLRPNLTFRSHSSKVG